MTASPSLAAFRVRRPGQALLKLDCRQGTFPALAAAYPPCESWRRPAFVWGAISRLFLPRTDGVRCSNVDLSFQLDQADVDVLTAAGLPARDGQHVGARAERPPRFFGDGHFLVGGGVAGQPGGQDAVEVDLRVLVMMQLQMQMRDRPLGQKYLASQPDRASVPLGADDGPGCSRGAEPARSRLPGQVVEVRPEPTIGRLGEGVAPGL